MEENETQLIYRAKAGDPVAFHQLVDQHAQHLFGLAYAMVGQVSDAEDVVQETFLAAFQGIKRFEGRSAFRTWLAGILSRQAALVHRKRRRARTVSWETAGEGAQSRVSLHADEVDAKLDVSRMLGWLSAEHREVLVMREYEGMSYEEIAEALKVPRGTVESRLHRARQEIRSRLTGYTDEKKS